MKIEDMRRKVKGTTIKDIEVGECFIDCDGDLCMKMEANQYYNTIVLSTGFIYAFDEDTSVTPVKAHIVIESEE